MLGGILLVAVLCAAFILGTALYQVLLLTAFYPLPNFGVELALGGWLWGAATTFLSYGPPEWAAFYLLVLSVAICLAGSAA